jgi:hypothetical protein
MRHSTRRPKHSLVRYAAASMTALLFAAAMPFDSSADSALCITQPPALAGSESVMVTFEVNQDLCLGDSCAPTDPTTSFDYLGVNYDTNLSAGWYTFAFNQPIPVVRYMTAPVLANTCDDSAGTCGPLRLQLTFDDPTPFFGFGYGFNDLSQDQDGTSTRNIGKVTLYNEYGRVIYRHNLKASRLLCCTEGRFDFTAEGTSIDTRKFVKTAIIEFSYDYVPFQPGVSPPQEATTKFFGIDNVSYAIPGCQ